MATGRSLASQAQAAERQIDVVGDHQQVRGGIELGLAHGRLERAAGQVHEALRLDEQDAADRFVEPRLELCGAVAHPALAGEAPAVGEQVDHPEAHVVAREPIALAGIAEAADQVHDPAMVAAAARAVGARDRC